MKYRPTLDMSSIPDAALKAEWARRNSAKRKINAGGRPMLCGGCGLLASCKACRLKSDRELRKILKEKC